MAASTYTPTARDDLVLSPNGYGGGLALFKIVGGGRAFRSEDLSYQTMDLDAFQDSTAAVNDRLYLIERGVPICVDMKTGARVWSGSSTRASPEKNLPPMHCIGKSGTNLS